MAKSLNDIAKEKRTQKAKRRTETKTETVSQPAPAPSNLVPTNSPGIQKVAQKTQVPGKFNPETISAKLPSFNANLYDIKDSANPPDTLPQVSESTHRSASATYDSAKFALSLDLQAAQVVADQYKVQGARFKAFGEGVKAATEAEKVEQLLTEYEIQRETNKQKDEQLTVAQHTTTNVQLETAKRKSISDEQLAGTDLKLESLKHKNKIDKDKLIASGWEEPAPQK